MSASYPISATIAKILAKCVDEGGRGTLAKVWSNALGHIATDGKILIQVGHPMAHDEDGRRRPLFDLKGFEDGGKFPAIPLTIFDGIVENVPRETLEVLVDDSDRRYEEALTSYNLAKQGFDTSNKYYLAQVNAAREGYTFEKNEIQNNADLRPSDKLKLKRKAAIERDAKIANLKKEKPSPHSIPDKPIRGGLGVAFVPASGNRIAFAGRYISIVLKALNIKNRGPATIKLAYRNALVVTFDDVKILVMPISLPN